MGPRGMGEGGTYHLLLLLLLLLSHFSHVRLCATPQTAAQQATPSLGFSRQEHWSGLPFPSPVHESESEVAQSCLILCDPMDCSLPGSSVYGRFQARVLGWDAIAFSDHLVTSNVQKQLNPKTNWMKSGWAKQLLCLGSPGKWLQGPGFRSRGLGSCSAHQASLSPPHFVGAV